ncbi:Uncharacterised protein [Streptococcus pneumoniae]|nr:Uncharacterised protein [Streptococcus pneumoniae]
MTFRIRYLNTILIDGNSFFWVIVNDIEPFANTVFIRFNAPVLAIICRYLVVVDRACQDLFPIDVHACLVQILLGWFNSRNVIYNCISLITVTEINLVSCILILTTCLTQFLLNSHWIGNGQNFSSLHISLVELLWILCLEYLNRSFRSEMARLQGFLYT